jgi:tripartite-type tricarboxylate transporter receptor subunit TctC
MPGYDGSLYYGVSAPKGTPADVIAVLNNAMNAALADPKMKLRIAEFGGMPLPGTPADFGRLVADETVKWEKVVRTIGLSIE